VLLATGLLTVLVAPFGIAATGDTLREGQRNGTADRETEIVSNVGASTGTKGGYSTRQSNLSSTGGGAIYGCRSGQGGSAANPPQNPCVRVNNLEQGFAFEFNTTKGPQAGTITVGSGGDGTRPFTTNATGVATGLNADRVDGLTGEDIVKGVAGANAAAAAAKTRWLLVNEKGEIEAQSGGFKVIDAYSTNDNVYIDAGAKTSDKGLGATIAVQNKIDVDGIAGADPNFGGEVSIAACQTAAVECAPAGAKNENAFVVAPRRSDGTVTTATTRKRVMVTVTP
jgi:hypothetical protein